MNPPPKPISLKGMLESALEAERNGIAISNWRDIAVTVFNQASEHVQQLEQRIQELQQAAATAPEPKAPRQKRK